MPKSANEKLLEQAVEDALDVARVTAKEREKVRAMLRRLKLNLKGRMSELPDLLKMSPSKRKAAIRKFLREADKEIASRFAGFGDDFTATLSELAVYEAAAAVTAINASVGIELAKTLNFNAEQAKVLVSETWISGSTVSEMMKNMEESFSREFKRVVREGYMMGETNDEIARRISGYTDKEGAYHAGIDEGVARKSAERWVRTATMGIANAVREEVFKSNEDVIKGRQWVATLDTRTCIACAARDGKAWDMDGKPLNGHTFPYSPPPLHMQCRCTMTAIMKSWEELGIDGLGEFDDGTRASMDGQVPGAMDFEEWFSALDEERQKGILGARRFLLYKQGKISFSDLVDQNGRGLTVEELRRARHVWIGNYPKAMSDEMWRLDEAARAKGMIFTEHGLKRLYGRMREKKEKKRIPSFDAVVDVHETGEAYTDKEGGFTRFKNNISLHYTKKGIIKSVVVREKGVPDGWEKL